MQNIYNPCIIFDYCTMAKWDQIRETSDVDDRRGTRTAGIVGGISVT